MTLPFVFLALLLQHADAWQPLRHGRGLLESLSNAGHSFGSTSARTLQRSGPSIPEPWHAPFEGSLKERAGYWMRRLAREVEIGVYSELEEYLQVQDKQADVECNKALRNQSLPTSAELGLAPWDRMMDLETIPARIAFLNQMTQEICSNGTGRVGMGAHPRVAAFGVWNGNMWGLRRSLLPWLQWSTHLGVCRFYIGYQGRDEQTFRSLEQIQSVSLILISPPFAAPEDVRKWRNFSATNDWAKQPGNWRLMAKQGYCGDIALARARAEGVEWMMHIDADELLLPATSLAADLAAVPHWAAAVKMHNHEALIESFEVTNKYEEVTLFKTHDATLPAKAGDLQWRFRLGTYAAYYQVYHNGKSIVRTNRAHVHMWGPHEFLGPRDTEWEDKEHNPEGDFKSVEGKTTLLHVSYASWRDLIGKARTSCPLSYREHAMAGNRSKVKECFCLDYDLDAYMASVRGEDSARDYWVITSLFSEGSVRKDGEKDGKEVRA